MAAMVRWLWRLFFFWNGVGLLADISDSLSRLQSIGHLPADEGRVASLFIYVGILLIHSVVVVGGVVVARKKRRALSAVEIIDGVSALLFAVALLCWINLPTIYRALA
jgi:hypothetical protein